MPFDFNSELIKSLPRLRRYASKLQSSPNCEDLLHSTAERCLTKQHLFTPGTNFVSWAMTIMHNIFVNRIRKDSNMETVPNYDEIKNLLVAKSRSDVSVLISEAKKAVSSLSKETQESLIRSTIGEKYEDIARDLNIPIGTVRSRIFRGREVLRNMDIL